MSLQNLLTNPHQYKEFVNPNPDIPKDAPKICVICGHPEHMHICEVCEHRYPTVMYKTMRMCSECYRREQEAQAEMDASADKRVEESRAIWAAKAAEEAKKLLEQQIEIRSDYFNANIPAHIEIRDAIFSNPDKSQQDKDFEYARYLKDDILHMQKVLIEMRDTETKVLARMKYEHKLLNEQANKLREDERKELQITAINYNPIAPKVQKTPTSPRIKSPKKAKVNQAEIAAAAKEHNIPEQVLSTLVNLLGKPLGVAIAEYRGAESSAQSES